MTTVEKPMFGIAAPEPGMYPGVHEATYHQWDAASQSSLNVLRHQTPAHLRERLLHPPKQTDDLLIGSALHSLVLEPKAFGRRYVVAEQCCAIQKNGERCSAAGKWRYGYDWRCGKHADGEGADTDKEILAADQMETAEKMRDSLLSNDLVASILYGAKVETSGVWIDHETGVLCKYRADIINQKHRIVADIKTTRDGSPQRFPKSIFDFGYHLQAAHYLEGVRAHGIDVAEFVLIVVEKEPPYSVSLFRINDQDIEGRVSAINRGRADRLAMLEIWRACRARNHWPDWGEEIIDIDLPRWA